MTGLRARVALLTSCPLFLGITNALIVGYAAFLGARTFPAFSGAIGHWGILADAAVTAFFVIEIGLRMLSLENPWRFLRDRWSAFDLLLVMFALAPSGIGRVALAIRVLRVLRLLRLVRSRPGLQKIIDTVFDALPTLIDFALLIFILLYVYAVGGSLLFGELNPRWKNAATSLLTMFSVLVVDNWPDRLAEVSAGAPYAWIFFVSFLFVGVFVSLSVFIAMMIDKVKQANLFPETAAAVQVQVREEIAALCESQDALIDELMRRGVAATERPCSEGGTLPVPGVGMG